MAEIHYAKGEVPTTSHHVDNTIHDHLMLREVELELKLEPDFDFDFDFDLELEKLMLKGKLGEIPRKVGGNVPKIAVKIVRIPIAAAILTTIMEIETATITRPMTNFFDSFGVIVNWKLMTI